MEQAKELAQHAYAQNEVPVGAVIIKNNKVVATAHNAMKMSHNAVGHAEILCIQRACHKLQSQFLIECDLYVTLEPCAMCAGAIANARIHKVYFGAYDPKGGGVCHGAKVFEHALWKPEWVGGIMEQDCQLLLTSYFQDKR